MDANPLWLESSCRPGLFLEPHAFLPSRLSSAVSSRDSACCPVASFSTPDSMNTSLNLRDPEGPYFLCEENGPDRFPSPSHTRYEAIGNSNASTSLCFLHHVRLQEWKYKISSELRHLLLSVSFGMRFGSVFEALLDSKVVKLSQLVPFSLTDHFSQILIATLYLFSLWPKVSSYRPTALLPSWWMYESVVYRSFLYICELTLFHKMCTKCVLIVYLINGGRDFLS